MFVFPGTMILCTSRNFVNMGQEKGCCKGLVMRRVKYRLSHKENSISTCWGLVRWEINK